MAVTYYRVPIIVCALLLLKCNLASAILCYTPVPEGPSVIAAEFKDPKTLCLRYQFPCTADDTACSPKELGKLKWAYATTTSAICGDLKRAPRTYKNVLCCSSDRCNAPDPKLDPATKVLPGQLQLADALPATAKPPK